MILKISTATGTVWAAACLPSDSWAFLFIIQQIQKCRF